MNPDSAGRGALVALGFMPGLGGADSVARVIPKVISMTESCQKTGMAQQRGPSELNLDCSPPAICYTAFLRPSNP